MTSDTVSIIGKHEAKNVTIDLEASTVNGKPFGSIDRNQKLGLEYRALSRWITQNLRFDSKHYNPLTVAAFHENGVLDDKDILDWTLMNDRLPNDADIFDLVGLEPDDALLAFKERVDTANKAAMQATRHFEKVSQQCQKIEEGFGDFLTKIQGQKQRTLVAS